MSDRRIHNVTTADGVTIGGTVHGQGPPLVFLQGVLGDGDIDWRTLVPHLIDRFTCLLPSMRGRGLSTDHLDLSLGRVIDDYLTYVESIGEPAGLVGWSGGASHALAVAARTDMVFGVAAFEPVANSLMDEDERAALFEAVAATSRLAAEGNLTAAGRVFAGYPFTDDDIALAEDAGYFEATARYVPHMVELFKQFAQYDGLMPDDPGVLGAVSAPVLVLHGSDTKPFMTASVRYVSDHVPNARIEEIPAAGHAAPITDPETFAKALIAFFSRAQDS